MPEPLARCALHGTDPLKLPNFSMREGGPAARLLFRGGDAARAKASEALDLPLPDKPCISNTRTGLRALWLGPDEWLLITSEPDGDMLKGRLSAALRDLPHSIVDVSHRDAEFVLSGPHCERVLNVGCPLDLAQRTFLVGTCTRTLVAKAQVVLWRPDEASFRLFVARSFSAYVWTLLAESARGWQAAAELDYTRR